MSSNYAIICNVIDMSANIPTADIVQRTFSRAYNIVEQVLSRAFSIVQVDDDAADLVVDIDLDDDASYLDDDTSYLNDLVAVDIEGGSDV